MPRADLEKRRAYSAAYYAANRSKCLAQNAARRKANPERASEAIRVWRAANPEKKRAHDATHRKRNAVKIAASAAAWHAANPDYAAGYYEANRELILARCAAWNLANPGRAAERAARRRRESPEKIAAQNAKRRAYKMQRTPAWADHEEIARFYELAAILSRGGVSFEVDHVLPLRGRRVSGLHVEHNLQVLPAYLNNQKSNRT